jgi:hypothetical protein
MNSTIRDAVDRIYGERVPLPADWTPERRTEFVDREAARLSTLAEQTSADRGEAAVAEWIARTGQQPDFLTKVGLLNTAALQGAEMVLAEELYAQLPPEPDLEPDLELSAMWAEVDTSVEWGNPDRWRTPRRSEPTPEVTALVARVWPAAPDLFAIKAEYLVQALIEDGMDVPSEPGSPLANQLAQLVEADARADGLLLR